MKRLIPLLLILTSCGPGPQTKEFFDNACKNYGSTKLVEAKVSKSDDKDDDDKADASPTPEPTPPDYDNRCSENDKKQILADESAKELHRWANRISESALGPSAAEIAVSQEKASRECDKLRACSGLALEVTIPPGDQMYHCGMRNGQNWIEIGCESPEPPQ